MVDETIQREPTKAEKTGYDSLNNEQLISSLLARDTDNLRLNKKLDETQSSCDALSRTIKEQSDTLNNRAEVVKEAEHQRDEATQIADEALDSERATLQRIDELTEVHERVKADALNLMQKGNDITAQQFADALDVYSLAVARISSTDAHPQIVVALVQMAMHIRGLATVADIITWLRGSQ